MERRKELIQQYKQRKSVGGVYRVVNIENGRYMLTYTANLQAKKNAFEFMVSSSSCFHHKLDKDWAAFGAKSFAFETLESLEKKEEQSQEEFLEDLKMLEQIWAEKLDTSMRY